MPARHAPAMIAVATLEAIASDYPAFKKDLEEMENQRKKSQAAATKASSALSALNEKEVELELREKALEVAEKAHGEKVNAQETAAEKARLTNEEAKTANAVRTTELDSRSNGLKAMDLQNQAEAKRLDRVQKELDDREGEAKKNALKIDTAAAAIKSREDKLESDLRELNSRIAGFAL